MSEEQELLKFPLTTCGFRLLLIRERMSDV